MPATRTKPTCPHLVIYEVPVYDARIKEHAHLRKGRKCEQEPRENGWCHTHQSGYLLMRLGASICFVELHVGSDKDRHGHTQERPLIIGEGYDGWYACAVNMDEDGLKRVRDAAREYRTKKSGNGQ